jgi:hypothetical protein
VDPHEKTIFKQTQIRKHHSQIKAPSHPTRHIDSKHGIAKRKK